MIKFGTLEGVKEDLTHWKSILKSIGDEGVFTLESKRSATEIKISDSISVKTSLPIKFNYIFVSDDELIITFHKPVPIVTFLGLGKFVSSITVALDIIKIGIDWSPDGYVEIKS